MGTPVAMIALPIFGILVMGLLLDVHIKEISKSKKIISILFLAFMLVLNIWVDITFGRPVYRVMYLFLVQLPLLFLFWIITSYKGIKVLFVMLTTITMASLPVNINLTVSTLIVQTKAILDIVLVISCSALIVLIYFFMKPDFNYILKYGDSKDFWKFCIIPVLYYIYGFGITGYNFTQVFSAEGFFVRRLPDVIVLVAYILMVNIFRNTREQQLMKSEQDILTLRILTAEQKMSELISMTMQAKSYRHDLRHHILLLNSFVAEGDIAKVKDYLAQAQGQLDKFNSIYFCENETVSLIISAFDNKAKAEKIKMQVDANLPANISIPDTEICAVFSNALENAIFATSKIEDEQKRIVQVECFIKNEKLMLKIENPCDKTVLMEEGIPVSTQEGHGFGCRSIAAIAKNRKGHCTFVTKDGVFIIRVILPL